jgi:2-succinyl-5-enolpyruvyl-6-hydroxy-3-cyclohexene-1-carboxylate synthase
MTELLLSDDAIEFRDQTVAKLLQLTLETAGRIAQSRNESRITREDMEDAVQTVFRSLIEHLASSARERRQKAAGLVESWLAEESDYDQRVWPRLAQEIEKNRLSNRKRLSG